LQESLRTKDKREAHVLAKPVLAKFDRLVAKAEAGTADVPVRAELSDQEITRIAAYHFAEMLSEDEEAQGLDFEKGKDAPQFGMSEREFQDHGHSLNAPLSTACTSALIASGEVRWPTESCNSSIARL
jgi:hypothetical protein